MSLITDTLNKMKKEQGSEENDEKMMEIGRAHV